MKRLVAALALSVLAMLVSGQGFSDRSNFRFGGRGGFAGSQGVGLPKSYWFSSNVGLHNNLAAAIGIDDNDGGLDSTSVTTTADERQKIANNPPMMLAAEFINNTTAFAIDRYKTYNPNFQWLMYLNYAHVDSGLVWDADARPFASYKDTVLTPWIAVDQSDAPWALWYDGGTYNAGEEPLSYAVDYITDTDPPAVDTERIDTYLEGWWHDFIVPMDDPPQGVMLDYFWNPGQGYQWYTAAGQDSLDLDDNGVGLRADTNEQEAFAAAQVYYIQKIRSLAGPNFLILGNGIYSWPDTGDSTLLAQLDGVYMEGIPEHPWSTGSPRLGYRATDNLWDILQDSPYRRAAPVVLLDFRSNDVFTGSEADVSRGMSLAFDATLFPRIREDNVTETESRFEDATFQAWSDSLGTPLGPVFVQSGTQGSPTVTHVYRRLFSERYLDLTVDPDNAAASQWGVPEIKDYADVGTFFVSNISATGDTTKVVVTFSDNVDTTTSKVAGNYTVEPDSISVVSTVLGGPTSVQLVLSPKVYEGLRITITGNNVESEAGDVLAPGSGASVTGPDDYPPAVASITQPQGLANTLRVAYNDTMNWTLADVSFFYSTQAGRSCTAADSVDYDTVDLTFDSEFANGEVDTLIIASVQDDNGNTISDDLWIFTADYVRPTMFDANQADADTNSVFVLFDKAMDATSVQDTTNWSIDPALGFDTITSSGGTVATVNFHGRLAPLTQYTITASGVTDALGNTIDSQNSYPFVTGDDVSPTLVSLAQYDSNTAELVWSEDITSASATNTSNYSLSPAITLSEVVYDSLSAMQLNFSSNLLADTVYTVTMNNIEDLAGNVIATDTEGTFSTASGSGEATCDGCPEITDFRWTSGSTLQIDFSSPMDKAGMEPVEEGGTDAPDSLWVFVWDGSAYTDSVKSTDLNQFAGDNQVNFTVENIRDGVTDRWYKARFWANSVYDTNGTYQTREMNFVDEPDGTSPDADPPTTGLFFGEGSSGGPATDPDTTGPDLDGARAPTLTSVVGEFDEVVDATTGENTSNWRVYPSAGGTDISISSASQANNEVTLTLASSMEYGTQYYVRAENVEDDSGNAQAAADSTTFTTISEAPSPSGNASISSFTIASGDDGESGVLSGVNFGTVTIDQAPTGTGANGFLEQSTLGVNGNSLTSAAGWENIFSANVPGTIGDDVVRSGSHVWDASINKPVDGNSYQKGLQYNNSGGFTKFYATWWVYMVPVQYGSTGSTNTKDWYVSPKAHHENCGSYSTATNTLTGTSTISLGNHQTHVRAYINNPDFTFPYKEIVPTPFYTVGSPWEYRLHNMGGTETYEDNYQRSGEWARVEVYSEASTPNVYDGIFEYWITWDDQPLNLVQKWTGLQTRNSNCINGNSQPPNGAPDWFWFGIQGYTSATSGTQTDDIMDLYYDDIHLQFHGYERVELGDSPNFASATHRELQPVTAWSDTSITIDFNWGTFNTGDTAYLYVVDGNGDVSTGHPITVGEPNGLLMENRLGSSAETTSPEVGAGTVTIVDPGDITYVVGEDGNATKLDGTAQSFDGTVIFTSDMFDFEDSQQNGGRIDMNVRFDVNPQTHPTNTWMLFDPFSSNGQRNINFELTGSPTFPGFLVSSSTPNTDRMVYHDTQQFRALVDGVVIADDYWNAVDSGEWHDYTFLWRNNGSTDKDELHIFIDGALSASAYNGNLPVTGDLSEVALDADASITVDDIYSWDTWNTGGATAPRVVSLAWPDSVYQKFPLPDGRRGDTNNTVTDANITFEWSFYEAGTDTADCIVYMEGSPVDTVSNVLSLEHAESDPITAAGSISNGDNTWQVKCNGGALVGPVWTFDYQGN